MDPQARRILEAFDAAPPVRTLSDLGDAICLRPIVEDMLSHGWLTPAGPPEAYRRTEDGRLALTGPLDVTLYTRRGCHLCDELKSQALPLIRRAGAQFREIDIDSDEVLRERYNTEVPVLLLGARKVAKYFLDPTQFQRQLEAARRAGPAETEDRS